MNVKALIERILRRSPPLFRAASRAYHEVRGLFFLSLAGGAGEALERALVLAKQHRGDDPGDYYEFGVFRGGTLLSAFGTARENGLGRMRFYGFDSFTGLPPLEEKDRGIGQFFEGQFSCERSKVERNLGRNGVDLARVALVEGYYRDSLTEELRAAHAFRCAAVVMLDCDLYSSTRDALAWMEPYLQDKTVLLFDDWESYGGEDGQPEAFADFLKKRPRLSAEEIFTFPKHGRAFLLDAPAVGPTVVATSGEGDPVPPSSHT